MTVRIYKIIWRENGAQNKNTNNNDEDFINIVS